MTLGGTPWPALPTRTVANNKPVTVTGFTLSGGDAGNYSLAQPAGLTANITPVGLTVTGITANNKPYDGTTAATLNLGGATLNGVLSGDVVTLNTSAATGAFADPSPGTGKTVYVSGLTLNGADAGNYSLTQPTTTASITATLDHFAITVSGPQTAGTPFNITITAQDMFNDTVTAFQRDGEPDNHGGNHQPHELRDVCRRGADQPERDGDRRRHRQNHYRHRPCRDREDRHQRRFHGQSGPGERRQLVASVRRRPPSWRTAPAPR